VNRILSVHLIVLLLFVGFSKAGRANQTDSFAPFAGVWTGIAQAVPVRLTVESDEDGPNGYEVLLEFLDPLTGSPNGQVKIFVYQQDSEIIGNCQPPAGGDVWTNVGKAADWGLNFQIFFDPYWRCSDLKAIDLQQTLRLFAPSHDELNFQLFGPVQLEGLLKRKS
jgi:hypothetical protein